ncbi:MAG TPA: Ig-like domain-containing protein [Kineosporiaceae bacterium]|nr:Ig-like domain-containing protein [Kineosporiaceae bacterium]
MRARAWWAAAVVAALGLTGCSGQSAPSGAKPSAPVAGGSVSQNVPATPAAEAMSVSVAPANGTRNVRPDTPVVVTVKNGQVTSADLVTDDGKHLEGAVDGASWRATDALKPTTSYTLKVTATSGSGQTSTTTSTFKTLTPQAFNRVTLVPGDDWTVGVGMPVVVNFASPVANRKAAEKALTVASTPSVDGAWRWMSSTEVQWRPKEYWPAGTKVKVTAAVGGVELSSGVWGRRTVTSTFAIGAAQISTVDIAKDTMTVTRNGKVIKVVPVTTGMTNSKPTFPTRGGIKVIMSREATVKMDAATTGTDPKDPNYYNLTVHWALRLTYSGEFLHAAPWSVGSQGRANVSHGCTGMSDANAKWMYDHLQIGDVVVYKNSRRPLEWGNGYTAWNKSFSDWASGA